VRTVLEGSVRRAGSRVRVAVQLINAADGYHLWSEKYDRELTDIFEVQDQIAVAIGDALRVRFESTTTIAQQHTPNFAAYEAFLKGRHYMLKATPDTLVRAKLALDEAIALDPRYSGPNCELGMYYVFMAMMGLGSGRDLAPLVRARAEAALALDESSAFGHALLGFVAATHDYDWFAAEGYFNQAVASPSVPVITHYLYSLLYLAPLGHAEAGIEEISKALERDPLNVVLRTGLAGQYFLAQMYDRSRAVNDAALEIDEAHWMANFGAGLLSLQMGTSSDAIAAFEQAYRIAPWNPQIVGHLAGCLAAAHHDDRADALLRQLLDGPAHLTAIGMTAYHGIRSDPDATAEYFEKAVESRHPLALVYARHPPCQVMRKSSRWPALAKMLNLSGVL
jgi:tetratricopeptide (TPR) repeat protein